MTDLITRARRAAGIAGNDTTGNLLIELVDTIERQDREQDTLTARLDRIEAWLTATHGYPYPLPGPPID